MSTSIRPPGCVDGQLAGRYRLTQRIAVGGMGEVWSAVDEVLGREVAVKLLRPEYVDDQEFRERFRAEARHAAGLSHPGIASVFDYGEQAAPQPAAWLVMELVPGEPLSALLRRTPRLSTAHALDVVGQAALALEAAHVAGVVHRDVKPGNLLVRPDGVVKVTDFGIARAATAVPVTRTGTMVGTAHYLSPEQAAGATATPASDVYCLGLVAYECLAGARPFVADSPVAVAAAHLRQAPPPLPDDVPGPVRELVMRALHKDPAQRPQHAGELGREALALREQLMSDDTAPVAPATRVLPAAAAPTQQSPAPVPPSRLPPRPGRSRRRVGQDHRRAVRLTSAALAVVVLGALTQGWLSRDQTSGAPTRASTAVSAAPAVRTGPVVREADYLGRPAAQVSAALTALGLRPRLTYDGAGRAAGTVSAVTPSGPLAAGSTVTVRVVPEPPAAKSKGKHKKGHDG